MNINKLQDTKIRCSRSFATTFDTHDNCGGPQLPFVEKVVLWATLDPNGDHRSHGGVR